MSFQVLRFSQDAGKSWRSFAELGVCVRPPTPPLSFGGFGKYGMFGGSAPASAPAPKPAPKPAPIHRHRHIMHHPPPPPPPPPHCSAVVNVNFGGSGLLAW